jgi:N-acylneuraminate cytidylyltransferase
MMSILTLIPARGGSKGIPGKNIKPLAGKPLIYYTLDVAAQLFEIRNICVSTDDPSIKKKVEEYGLIVPFMRPAELATDYAGSYEVILHALDFYSKKGIEFSHTLLLQPTSPFRKAEHVKDCLEIARNTKFEMIISVKETDANPYMVLYEEADNQYLKLSKQGNFVRRQDCPKVWQANGAIYLIDNNTLIKRGSLNTMQKTKFVMDAIHSVDLDTPLDWKFAECLLQKKLITFP